jgi:uncharacterized membrane protein
MEPLITLVAVTAILLGAGALGVRTLRPWPVAVRGGLAAMFTLTGVVHFVGMRQRLVEMVPPALPNPELLVTITGVLELAGAVGLLLPRTARWAAGGLTVLLVAMFPANVHAALEGTDTPLLPRTLMQLLFLAATLAVVVSSRRGARRSAAEGTRSDAAPEHRTPDARDARAVRAY